MTIYTAIFGPYDDLKEPLVVTEGWKYICFTDQNLKSDVWQIEKRSLINGDARRTSKHYKILFHEHIEDRYSIWVDGSFYVNCDLNVFWQRFVSPVTLLKHPSRDCVYQEAKACIQNRRDRPEIIRKQIERYRAQGLPANSGMSASGIMLREITPESREFSELWYYELVNGCGRDQISYAYVNWKMPVATLTDWDYTCRTEFLFMPHLSAPDRRKAKLSHYKKLKLI